MLLGFLGLGSAWLVSVAWIAAPHRLALLSTAIVCIAGAGGLIRLPRAIPPKVATELILTGRRIGSEEAHRLGLINHLVAKDQVMVKAKEVAAELGAKPPIAMRLNKQRFRELTEASFRDAEQAGMRIQSEAFESGEPQEMMRRFFEVRAERKQPGPR